MAKVYRTEDLSATAQTVAARWLPARPATPAPGLPLPLRDLTFLTACSRREALLFLAATALLTTPLAAAAAEDPLDEDTQLQRLEARLAADPRLDQKVSLNVWSEPLEDVLARLSREPEAVVFTLATGAPALQEERVPLERGRAPAPD